MASEEKSRRERVIEGMAIWGSYYRENFDLFVEEYLQLDFLKWFQTMLLVMMNRSRVFLWIAARGMGKSFLIAIFAVARVFCTQARRSLSPLAPEGRVLTFWRRYRRN